MRTLFALVMVAGPVLMWSAAARPQTTPQQADDGADSDWAIPKANLQTSKDSAEIVVHAAVQCSNSQHNPKILTDTRARLRDILIGWKMPDSDADDFLDRSIEVAKGEPPDSAEDQVDDCRFAGVNP